MKKYEILEHPTDLKIRAFGKTKAELFLNMMIGMFEAAKPEIKDKSGKIKEVKIKSSDEPSLLVNFLSEVLALSDINNEAYFEVKFKKLIGTELIAEIFGQPIFKMGLEIKAVTYHGAEIKKTEDGWEAEVLFDI